MWAYTDDEAGWLDLKHTRPEPKSNEHESAKRPSHAPEAAPESPAPLSAQAIGTDALRLR